MTISRIRHSILRLFAVISVICFGYAASGAVVRAPACVRVVRNMLYDDLSGYGQAGAPVSFGGDGRTAGFTLASGSSGYSLLAAELPLVQNASYALTLSVANYSGNYPGTNFMILNATPGAFLGVMRVNFQGNGIYSLVFTYTGASATFLARFGINVEAGVSNASGPGGFTISDVSLEQLPSANAAPSPEYVRGQRAWAFNYPNLDTYDTATGLVTLARGANCATNYHNVWGVAADSFGDDAYDFPQQLANNIETKYAFYVDSVPGRKLSTAAQNIPSLLSVHDVLLGGITLPSNAAAPNGLLIEGGINDIVQDSTAAQLEAVTASIIADVESESRAAVLFTVSPFGKNGNWTAAREQVRLAYNQWVRTQASMQSRIYVYDMAAGMSAGGIAENANAGIVAASFDAGDGLHPNAAGGLQIATGVKHILDTDFPLP
jgi:hypothetical protein